MKNRTRTFAALLAGPAIGAGILLGGMAAIPATAGAQPASGSSCSDMSMSSAAGAGSASGMTRAGMIANATGAPSASDGPMAVNCQAGSHG